MSRASRPRPTAGLTPDEMAALVPHGRYGARPIPSGLTVPEAEIRRGFWRHDREKLFPESVLLADVAKQNYAIYPRKYYVDMLRRCQGCERPFIFFAREQRHWYETLRFHVEADCVHCPTCRHDMRALAAQRKTTRL